MDRKSPRRVRTLSATAALLAAGLFCTAGCERKPDPTTCIDNPGLGPMRIAVAPALNFSGSTDFDPNAVADLMASELSHVVGVEVIPVSRVLAVLARQGRSMIESPEHALEVAAVLGTDALLVFAVTEYDPYEPMVVGMTAQLYGPGASSLAGRVDPILVTRSPVPLEEEPAASPLQPLAHSSRVFNAGHEPVVREVKEFARHRGAEGSVFGWRKFMVSQNSYIRFCCHATIKQLVRHSTVLAPAMGEPTT